MEHWTPRSEMEPPFGYVDAGRPYGPRVIVADCAPVLDAWPYRHRDALRNRCAVTRALALTRVLLADMESDLLDTGRAIEDAHESTSGVTLDGLESDVRELENRIEELES